MATVTAPVNEFAGVARTLTWAPAPPAVKLSVAGETASAKSGGGAATVRAIAAVWLSVPDVPVKVMVAAPATAVEAAVSVMVWAAPGVKLTVAGVNVTPAGSPAAVTATGPVKPFSAAAATLIAVPVAPDVNVTVAGVAAKVKSGVAGVAGVVGWDEPLQESSPRQTADNESAITAPKWERISDLRV
ncbi:hypothetical protein [Acidisarcina polymorpha]|uniref:hypothetical protein n=1 Tax=Acidisarcina polymorpha TaxID=2211140 RepID=UPI001F266D4A|nr:hypothetical protein [Acidisarcina polymorpha]